MQINHNALLIKLHNAALTIVDTILETTQEVNQIERYLTYLKNKILPVPLLKEINITQLLKKIQLKK